ncbi:MAG: 4-hydroxy-tetrahydrodipicolinate reductase [Candidatus Sericytochromatia bacterium]|nr:4-hydroxy-tetrahydrodipicolinate reductase [Candidatus Sericytochromatia bacterium]
MSAPIRVALAGAAGQMGREVVRAVTAAADMQLVAAIAPRHAGQDAGLVAGLPPLGLVLRDDLAQALAETRPDVLVDFTRPDTTFAVAEAALAADVRPVIGTTGLTEAQLTWLGTAAQTRGLGVLVAPNFALGALLMMRFAAEAARHFAHAEIVELHHDRKRDAPSGTALKTVEAMRAQREAFEAPSVAGEELLPGARGGEAGGVRLHSVRLPGLLAHQEVLFGGEGQLLTIRHDAFSRACYMPGVLLGIRRILDRTGLVHGLEHLL